MREIVEAELGGLDRVFRGYAPATVESLLRELAVTCDRTGLEVAELRERAASLRDELEGVLAPERELGEAFVTAQREAEELRVAAAAEAAELRAGARRRTDERRAWLDEEAARIRDEIERMRSLEDEFQASVRLILLEALRRLDGEPVPTFADEPDEERPEPPAPPPAAEGPLEGPEPPTAVEPPSVEDDTMDMPIVSAPVAPDEAEVVDESVVVDEAVLDPWRTVEEPGRRELSLRSLLLAFAILVTGAGIAVAIWQLRTEAPEPAPTATGDVRTGVTVETETGAAQPAAQTGTVQAAQTAAETAPAAAEPEGDGGRSPGAALVLRAANGDCWLAVRSGSAGGKLLFEGFLYRGERRRFEGERLWIRMGNGGNLAARLNGEPLGGLPAGTADVLITADGARTLALG